jgi:hypothetical protein
MPKSVIVSGISLTASFPGLLETGTCFKSLFNVALNRSLGNTSIRESVSVCRNQY